MRQGSSLSLTGRMKDRRQERKVALIGVEVFCVEDRHVGHRTRGHEKVRRNAGDATRLTVDNGDRVEKFQKLWELYELFVIAVLVSVCSA